MARCCCVEASWKPKAPAHAGPPNARKHYGKPLFIADPAALADVPRVHHWIDSRGIRTLNVAGPSESSSPGIGEAAERFVAVLLRLDALYGHES